MLPSEQAVIAVMFALSHIDVPSAAEQFTLPPGEFLAITSAKLAALHGWKSASSRLAHTLLMKSLTPMSSALPHVSLTFTKQVLTHSLAELFPRHGRVANGSRAPIAT